MKLTLQQLTDKGACQGQVDLFHTLFGDSVDVTEELCASVAGKFDFYWAASNLLTPSARAEYERARKSARAEYERARKSARAEYYRVAAVAWAEFERATAPARAEYYRVAAVAWAEFERATAPARAEYKRATAVAFAIAYNSQVQE